MHSQAAVEAFRTLSARYHVDPWTEPVGVATHFHRLQAMLDDATPGDYPARFDFDRRAIGDYLADWSALAEQVAGADLPAVIASRVLADIEHKVEFARTLAGGDDAAYAQVQRDQVGLPTPDLVATAWSILNHDLAGLPFPVSRAAPDPADTVSAAELRQRMERALNAYGLSGWRAIVEPNMSAQASVNGPQRLARVRAGAQFSAVSAERLLAHEIGGHVLRWANALRQPEAWLSVPLGRGVPTEEGLAVWREVEFAVQSVDQLGVYAARVVAVDAAQRLGLADVARLVSPHVGTRRATEIAIRTKRGLGDPNQPGGQTKDWGYLAGLATMADLAARDPDGLVLLAGVKWPVDDLDVVVELRQRGRAVAPDLLPDRDRLGLGPALV
jgi:hypothetical protein